MLESIKTRDDLPGLIKEENFPFPASSHKY